MLMPLGWEPKTAYPGHHGTTIKARIGDWIAHTPISQPAGVAAVQSCELPGGVELAYLGYVGPVVQTRLSGFSEVELVSVLQEVHLPWTTFKKRYKCF